MSREIFGGIVKTLRLHREILNSPEWTGSPDPLKNALEANTMECAECGDEVETLVKVKLKSKTKKLCQDCADRVADEDVVSAEAESAMRSMMEYKGK